MSSGARVGKTFRGLCLLGEDRWTFRKVGVNLLVLTWSPRSQVPAFPHFWRQILRFLLFTNTNSLDLHLGVQYPIKKEVIKLFDLNSGGALFKYLIVRVCKST